MKKYVIVYTNPERSGIRRTTRNGGLVHTMTGNDPETRPGVLQLQIEYALYGDKYTMMICWSIHHKWYFDGMSKRNCS
ncbi:unnamed protein product [Absidia cylindrospora]